MKTSPMMITYPNNPRATLEAMLRTDYAFTNGRRNNDVVNWFLLVKMIELEEGGLTPPRKEHEYAMLFRAEVRPKLDGNRQKQLDYWDDGLEQKLETLHGYYGKITDADQLRNLWLPADYEVPQP